MPQLILNYTAPVANRIVDALGDEQRLVDGNGVPRSATAQEVKDFLADVLKRLVQGNELKRSLSQVAQPADVPIT